MNSDADHCRALLGAYVLGSCPPPEAAWVAAHLAECDSCCRDVRRLRDGVQALRADVVSVTPGPWVKDSVMAHVRADAALFDAARVRQEVSVTRVAPPAGRSWRIRSAWPSIPVPVAAFACALVLALTGGVLASSVLRADRQATSVVRADIERELAPAASGTLEQQDSRVQLHVDRLPSPGSGRVYQVWVRTARQAPRPMDATFSVDERGGAHIDLPGSLDGVDQVLVTSEPAGGSEVPTRLPVMHVDL